MEELSRNSSAHTRTRRLPPWYKTIPYQSGTWQIPGPAEIAEVEKYEKDLAEWIEKDALAQHTIASTLPNTLFMRIQHRMTAEEYFDVLRNMFEKWAWSSVLS